MKRHFPYFDFSKKNFDFKEKLKTNQRKKTYFTLLKVIRIIFGI